MIDELVVAFGDFEQVAMLHFCGDICEQLATMSRTLQADNADVHVALSNADGLIQSLESCYPPTGPVCWGPRVTRLLRRSPNLGSDNPSNIPVANKQHKIKVTAAARDRFYQAARGTVELLVQALRERMPDSAIIGAMLKLLDARALPEGNLPADYGNAELDTVLLHFAPHAMATELREAADANAADVDLEARAKKAELRARGIKANDYVDADKLRSEWARFKFGMLKSKSGSGYQTIYRLLHNTPNRGGYTELYKVGGVLVILAMSNAISERGFSAMNNAKTKKKGRLSKGLDPKLRVVFLGPSDDSGIEKLVDAATAKVFGGAVKGRAVGARAANLVRSEKKEKKKERSGATSDSVINGKLNSPLADDGSASQISPSATFPSDKYATDVAMPELDSTMKGRKVFYVVDDGKGGYKFQKFNVTKDKGGATCAHRRRRRAARHGLRVHADGREEGRVDYDEASTEALRHSKKMVLGKEEEVE